MDVLRGMEVFAAVVDAGSFAGAARALDLAPAVVTRLVAELEQHLGVRLLNRTTRRLALTDVGDAYLQRARGILSEVAEAASLAEATTAQAQGQLRVLVPPGLAIWLAGQLPAFRQAYPAVRLDFTSWGMVTAPEDGYDVSLLIVAADTQLDGGYVARLLARSEVVLCASPAYLATHPPLKHPRDLVEHECLVPVLPNQPRTLGLSPIRGGKGSAKNEGQSWSITPEVTLSSNHTYTLHAAAIAGMGLLALPSYQLQQSLSSGALVRVLPEWHMARYHVYAAIPSRQYLPARTRVFLDFLVQCMGGQDRDPWLATPAPSKPMPARKRPAAKPARRPQN